MNVEQFDALASQGYNRIPLVREVLADFDTPLSTYLKLADGPYSYLFESVQGGEKWGRYSMIGLPCRMVVKVTGKQIEVEAEGEVVESLMVDDPLVWIEEFQERYKVAEVDGQPRFNGGLVGYFGYDTIRYPGGVATTGTKSHQAYVALDPDTIRRMVPVNDGGIKTVRATFDDGEEMTLVGSIRELVEQINGSGPPTESTEYLGEPCDPER